MSPHPFYDLHEDVVSIPIDLELSEVGRSIEAFLWFDMNVDPMMCLCIALQLLEKVLSCMCSVLEGRKNLLNSILIMILLCLGTVLPALTSCSMDWHSRIP